MEGVSLGQHPTPPEGSPDVIKSLMLCCWKQAPRERITFDKIVEELDEENLKASMGHSNSIYGTVKSSNCGRTLKLAQSKHDAGNNTESKEIAMNTKELQHEKCPSWPKLTNFSSIATSISNEPRHAEFSNGKPNLSTESVLQYTVILPEKELHAEV